MAVLCGKEHGCDGSDSLDDGVAICACFDEDMQQSLMAPFCSGSDRSIEEFLSLILRSVR